MPSTSSVTAINLFTRFIAVVIFMGFTGQVKAQDLNRQGVNLLLRQLQNTKADTTRVRIFTELGKFHVFKPGELKADLDSGYNYISRAKQLSDSLHLTKWQHENESMQVIISMERGNETLARALFRQAINNFQKSNDKVAEALLKLRLGIWLSTKGATAEVLANFNQAAAIYHDLKMPEQEIRVLKEIASVHFDEGMVDTAEAELLNVLKRFNAIHYRKLHYTYNLLSTVCRVKGDFNKALMYCILCIKSMNSTRDTSAAANFYADLARIYMEVNNRPKGVEWYKKAIAQWRIEHRTTFGMYISAGYIADDLIRRNKAAEALHFIQDIAHDMPPVSIIQRACIAQNLAYCYDALKQARVAEKYYLQALQLYTESKMDFEVSQEAQRVIGKFYLNQQEYDKAGNYLRNTLKANPQKLSAASLKDVHYMLFRVDSAQHNYLSSIEHFKKHKQLNDSIFSSRKAREIEELQIQYETEKKTQDLKLLNNKSQVQQTELQQANTIQKLTLGGVASLLIIIGLLFNQYKIKQRSNSELQLQKVEISQKNDSLQQLLNEKEWLLKEIHHRVKNNLQIVISLLNTQSTYLENDAALNAIRESQHRMYSISLIHQKLYQSDNLALINIADYIKDLVYYLKDSFDISQYVYFNLELMPVKLDVSYAVPVGLILNEAITNAIKYAVSPQRKNNISLAFVQQQNNMLTLTVADDGPGFPEEFDVENCNSLGMNLIIGLSHQLNGSFTIERVKNQTILSVSFKYIHIAEDAKASLADLQNA